MSPASSNGGSGLALWKLDHQGTERWARGNPETGPAEVLAGFDLDEVLAGDPGALHEALRSAAGEPLDGPARLLTPLGGQEVWASGVTFERSRVARNEEAGTPDYYDRVYEAERPELFFKARAGGSRGPGQPIAIRSDSGWDVPEPEVGFVISAGGRVVACTIGNDVSSRAIEGANPLYLPQAKVYRGSCAVGPCLVPVQELPSLEELVINMAITRGEQVIYSEHVGVAQMRRQPQELADWLFRALDFPVGVVLLSGTAIVPDKTLAEGDVVTVRIPGIGELTNHVEVLDAGPPVEQHRGPAVQAAGSAAGGTAPRAGRAGRRVGRRGGLSVPGGEMPARVALFVSCVADLAAPSPARAAVEVLEAMGVEVVVPEAQTCCGQPALNSGYPAEAMALARRWVETFEPFEAVVSPSGSCVATVHHHYPRLLPDPWGERARVVAGRCHEFTQFVAAHGAGLPLKLDTTVAYHDSCHMLRSLGERRAPREVLGRIEGLRLVEMDDADVCCGFGGTFSTKLPDISVAMADQKLDCAGATGVDMLVSADPGCLMHIGGRAARRGEPLVTRHVAEVVRDALRGGGVRG